jgi:hypothetical protein
LQEGEECKWNWRMKLRTAVTSGKQRNSKKDPLWDCQREDYEAKSRILRRITKNQGLGIVEGSASTEIVDKPTCIISIRKGGDVGALVTLDSEHNRLVNTVLHMYS